MGRTCDYDFLLAGATGQIGRALYPELTRRGPVFLVGRDCPILPVARHVVNCAGHTKFDDDVDRLWEDNLRLSVRLAAWATRCDAYYHQFSSEAVAEYRTGLLSETVEGPWADPRMNDYALSKVAVEALIGSMVPLGRLFIYRCSDVVPHPDRLEEDWRPNHWLSILFSAGKSGFEPPDGFQVWIADATSVAQAIGLLIEGGVPGAYHLLGHKYAWSSFHNWAQDTPTRPFWPKSARDRVTAVVRIDPPLATSIDQITTVRILRNRGFEWPVLPPIYWWEFAAKAVQVPTRKGV